MSGDWDKINGNIFHIIIFWLFFYDQIRIPKSKKYWCLGSFQSAEKPLYSFPDGKDLSKTTNPNIFIRCCCYVAALSDYPHVANLFKRNR